MSDPKEEQVGQVEENEAKPIAVEDTQSAEEAVEAAEVEVVPEVDDDNAEGEDEDEDDLEEEEDEEDEDEEEEVEDDDEEEPGDAA